MLIKNNSKIFHCLNCRFIYTHSISLSSKIYGTKFIFETHIILNYVKYSSIQSNRFLSQIKKSIGRIFLSHTFTTLITLLLVPTARKNRLVPFPTIFILLEIKPNMRPFLRNIHDYSPKQILGLLGTFRFPSDLFSQRKSELIPRPTAFSLNFFK